MTDAGSNKSVLTSSPDVDLVDTETKVMGVQQSHYRLIYDASIVKQFLQHFGTTLKDPGAEQYMSFLAARRKYCDGHKDRGTTGFKRFPLSGNDPDMHFRMLQQYEVPLGSYTDHNGKPIENKALVMYFLLNPRCSVKGYFELQTNMGQLLSEVARGLKTTRSFSKVSGYHKSALQKSKSPNRLWVELDVDTKDPAVLSRVREVIKVADKAHECTIETRGGFHVIYRLEEVKHHLQEFHRIFKRSKEFQFQEPTRDKEAKMIAKYYVDINTDPSPPVPGTIQGGFHVRYHAGIL